MATASRITVSTTAVRLDPGSADSIAGSRLVAKNTHATDALVLGGSTVTAANGFSLAAGATLEVFLDNGDSLYGIRGAAADITAHVLSLG